MDIVNVLVGLAIAAGVFSLAIIAIIIGVIVYGARHVYYAIRGEEYVPLLGSGKNRQYRHLDVNDGATADTISAVLKDYARLDIVGKYAQSGLTALDDERRKNSSFYAVLDKKFQPHSLSWDKFAVAADAVHGAILQNCATLANHVQMFDRAGYRQSERARRSSTYRKGEMIDPAQAEKQRLLQTSLADMDAIVAANDQLLLELDRLSIELGKLVDAHIGTDSDRIVDEIRTLIDETKYYSGQAD